MVSQHVLNPFEKADREEEIKHRRMQQKVKIDLSASHASNGLDQRQAFPQQSNQQQQLSSIPSITAGSSSSFGGTSFGTSTFGAPLGSGGFGLPTAGTGFGASNPAGNTSFGTSGPGTSFGAPTQTQTFGMPVGNSLGNTNPTAGSFGTSVPATSTFQMGGFGGASSLGGFGAASSVGGFGATGGNTAFGNAFGQPSSTIAGLDLTADLSRSQRSTKGKKGKWNHTIFNTLK